MESSCDQSLLYILAYCIDNHQIIKYRTEGVNTKISAPFMVLDGASR
jgi:hypothetical protein